MEWNQNRYFEKEKDRQNGFTLIEIMVVVVIIGILSTLILPRVLGRQEQAFITKANSDIQSLTNALKLYKLDNYQYPATDMGLEALIINPGTGAKNWKEGGYIDRLPKDPWGSDYQYLSPGEHNAFDLWSFGPDGVAGGQDNNADITSWVSTH
ncbi:MAG: type II secretion system protein GspG [Gammaproteobacteria bacterium]|nr:type II secretion system protein GspG [Gammaproteobacteria bacterium]